ncbi:MAG: tRNA (adenosine(37)-N6)-threonylcarbamoyltransferase complex dimerization subunit type 1 TsaB [Candidatus Buchananbacteria bacterium RIFCSPHIGHO2_01_FULL_44_11]|uniref:tRNA (Adenosine(37)-N6)-threonylcarbamoyltransferase complex dimerization subunit type 1 TsaB n=1 Tax=Candidatus Buchananbacteria bacterium RIFCSPHIGHO2_01_FULL_44_11 TaxID=1797535 RepID=A0A1G1Y0R9_9BACT|nr:MAG: tRNA (adenosine(37)-N6)-threonylcarbamoyltransferase complex dimerization subunit type 1 TsaB [Candidatus Buchananbacteria bacterium RIFCSPHIGHO2_01_FULL_44_11]
MILVINTADAKKVFIALVKNGQVVLKNNFLAHHRQSETLLSAIEKILKTAKTTSQKLRGIIVALGPGPFTALRIGIVIANTLSYALQIPAAGVKLTGLETEDDFIQAGLAELKGKRGVSILTPFYGQPPNITKSKQLKDNS